MGKWAGPSSDARTGLIFYLFNFLQMSTINKTLSGFIFNGAALTLASASFKSNLNSISGFNAAGTGYTSYRPGNTFNSLTELKQDGSYIVDAKTTGFDIPGATLTATSAALVVGIVSASFTPIGDKKVRVNFRFKVPTPTANVTIYNGVPGGDIDEPFSDILTSDTDHMVIVTAYSAGDNIFKIGLSTEENGAESGAFYSKPVLVDANSYS